MIVREVPADPFLVAARLSPPAVVLDASLGLSSPLVSRAVSLWPELAADYPFTAEPFDGLWVWRTPRGGQLALWNARLPAQDAAAALARFALLEGSALRLAVEVPVDVNRLALLCALRAEPCPLHLLACMVAEPPEMPGTA